MALRDAARSPRGVRPLTGAAGLQCLPFIVANGLGAAIFVPYAAGIGYAIGCGLGERVERLRRLVGEVEHVTLIAALAWAMALLGLRALRAKRGS